LTRTIGLTAFVCVAALWQSTLAYTFTRLNGGLMAGDLSHGFMFGGGTDASGDFLFIATRHAIPEPANWIVMVVGLSLMVAHYRKINNPA
jgi:hypothetical protein